MLAEAMMMEDAGLGVTGWLAVFVYLVVGWLCLRAFMVEKSGPKRPYLKSIAALWRVVKKHWPTPPTPARRAGLWVCLALLMFALGVNRLFDIEDLLLDLWRAESMEHGTYGERRAMQGGFIGAVGVMGLAVVVVLFRIARGQLEDFRLVLFGAIFVLAFVVIRAASLHAVDGMLRKPVMGIPTGVLIELLALCVVGIAAIRRLRRAGETAPKATAKQDAGKPTMSWLEALLRGPPPDASSASGSRPAGAIGSSAGASRPAERRPRAAPAQAQAEDSAPIKITQLN